MLKKIVLAGSAAAVVLGAGTAALATSGSSTPSAPGSSPAASSAKAGVFGKAGALAARAQLRRALHATWVTRNAKDSSGFVTHDAIRGQVTAVSATSITVKAADNVSETYVVTDSTKVRTRADGEGKPGSIGEVKSGDKVIVVGTGSGTLTATHVLDGGQ